MLKAEQFADYFQAVHGCDPFPWQVRLLEFVVRENTWPATLSLPTGAGKTSVLDIAVFALACGAKVARRTVLVVDRRIVVDDAFRRAEKIRDALNMRESVTHILAEVRDALKALGGDSPLEVALLRGGIYREDNWARHPLQPLLVCSTVDQVGSRLLHRGYGVSPHTWSIHAGLLANDTLIVLDEAHTSEPFRQTLGWIERYRKLAEIPLDLPFGVVTMTATPRETEDVFELNTADREHPILAKRLITQKNLRLVVASKPNDEGLVDSVVEEVQSLVCHEDSMGKTILVVMNRVRTAREVAEKLDALRMRKKDGLYIEQPLLLTGRSRSLERDALLNSARSRIQAGRQRSSANGKPPLVVVATQCVEVGADLDADVLVSEACPIDSLRQRLGRLDRLGELGNSDAYLIAPREVKPKDGDEQKDPEEWKDDLVYGARPKLVWQFLRSLQRDPDAAIDVGISAWSHLLSDVAPEIMVTMQTDAPDAPVMFPAYCDLWVQTSPEPSVIPEPSIFLHGIQRGEPEVQIAWRADLDPAKPETWAACISVCPPVVGETLRIPIGQVRQWLSGKMKEAKDGSDLEGDAPTELVKDVGALGEFLRWKGPENSEITTNLKAIRPGDTLVFPSTRGGCDQWGWAPKLEKEGIYPVTDLADEARLAARRTPVLRVHPSLMERLPSSLRAIETVHSESVEESLRDTITLALSICDENGFDPDWSEMDRAKPERIAVAKAIQALRQDWKCDPHPSGVGWILTGRQRMESLEFRGEDDTASHLERAVTLEQHLKDVGKVAERFANLANLSNGLERDTVLAGALHDTGKADPNFQALLHGGSRIKAASSPLLAKSMLAPVTGSDAEKARQNAGYPAGARHELLSVRLAESSQAVMAMANDPELVLHLIASHHGRCRPFAPIVEHPKPRQVKYIWNGHEMLATSDCVADGIGIEHIASGVPDRFWRLVRRYGWWGLSYLEACLRLADWRASALEAKGEQP